MKFISGLENCHLPGLYSLVISERESDSIGMKRVFYCSRSCKMSLWEGADFRVKPHNHRQDIKLTLLFGSAQNVTVKFGYGEHRLFCYRFKSALLNGDFSVEKMNFDNAHTVSEPITKAGLSLHWSVVHTVAAEPNTAWLVEEGNLAPPDMERVWSADWNLNLSSEGLYRPMTRRDLNLMEFDPFFS